jgi:Cysteine-rich secretory protein family
MKKLILLTLAALTATGLLPMTAAFADGPSDEATFVARINSLRASKGLPGLAVDAGLTGKARAWAQTMADKNTIWHSVLSDGITADWQRLGENVGMGGSVEGLDAAFVKSPHHYDNLVDPNFGSIGLGVVRGAGGVIFVAEEFLEIRAVSVTPVARAIPVVAIVVKAPTAVHAPTAVKGRAAQSIPAARKTPAAAKDRSRRVAPPGMWIAAL